MSSRTCALIGFFIATSWLGASKAAVAEERQKVFESHRIKSIDVKLISGNITVRSTSSPKSLARVTGLLDPILCATKIELSAEGTLLVSRHELDDTDSQRKLCAANITVEVDPSTAISLDLDTGHSEVEGMQGRLSFAVREGNVRVKKSAHEFISGKLGVGNLRISAETIGGAQLAVDEGKVKLAMAQVPQKGRLDIKLGAGDSLIYLPDDTKLKAHFKTGRGQFFNEFTQTPQAGFEVEVNADAGSLRVKMRGEHQDDVLLKEWVRVTH